MRKRPNVLLLVVDQLTASALPIYANPVVKTPHLSRFAEQASLFRNAYCNYPSCAPSRYSMLTGQLASRISAYDNASELSSTIPTVAHYLRLVDYHTCLVGKMHFVGADQLHGYEQRLTTDIYPSDFGWTVDWERPEGASPPGSGPILRSINEAGICHRSLQIDYDDHVEAQAIQRLFDYARAPDEQPFFLTVSFSHPHPPFTITPDHWDLYSGLEIPLPDVPELPDEQLDPHSRRLRKMYGLDHSPLDADGIRRARRAYYGMISYIDEKVGRLLQTLDRAGLQNDTIVIFTSDHGEMLGERGLWFKFSFFEPSIRVPLLIHIPSQSARRELTEVVSLVDLLPTIVDLVQGDGMWDPVMSVDGRSLAPLLNGSNIPWKNEFACEYFGDGARGPCVMLRRDGFKYMAHYGDPGLLFDLNADPREINNLATLPQFESMAKSFANEIEARWPIDHLRSAVLENQRARRFVHGALMKGHGRPWDYQPFVDASTQFVRAGSSPTATKSRARFPRFGD